MVENPTGIQLLRSNKRSTSSTVQPEQVAATSMESFQHHVNEALASMQKEKMSPRPEQYAFELQQSLEKQEPTNQQIKTRRRSSGSSGGNGISGLS